LSIQACSAQSLLTVLLSEGTEFAMSIPTTDIAVQGGLNGFADGLKRQDDTNKNQPDIAICGVGIRLPGGIRNAKAFWDLMNNELDIRIASQESQHQGQPADDRVRHRRFLRDDHASFDQIFFSAVKDSTIKCDLYKQKLLEITHECLEDACEVNYRGSSGDVVACYVATPPNNDDTMNGAGKPSTAKCISQHFDLQGPR
jgi:acyl transferase domain-containing protein